MALLSPYRFVYHTTGYAVTSVSGGIGLHVVALRVDNPVLFHHC